MELLLSVGTVLVIAASLVFALMRPGVSSDVARLAGIVLSLIAAACEAFDPHGRLGTVRRVSAGSAWYAGLIGFHAKANLRRVFLTCLIGTIPILAGWWLPKAVRAADMLLPYPMVATGGDLPSSKTDCAALNSALSCMDYAWWKLDGDFAEEQKVAVYDRRGIKAGLGTLTAYLHVDGCSQGRVAWELATGGNVHREVLQVGAPPVQPVKFAIAPGTEAVLTLRRIDRDPCALTVHTDGFGFRK